MKSILPKKAKRWLGAALAFAVTASFAATPDALIHRWSFNNSLEDTGSIGGMTVTLQGNAALYNKTSVRVQRGGDPVELGANPIPSDLRGVGHADVAGHLSRHVLPRRAQQHQRQGLDGRVSGLQADQLYRRIWRG